MDNIKGKSAIVTGASGGICHQICINLLKQNIKNLALVDLQKNESKFIELQTQFPKANIIFEKVNICDKNEIESAYKRIKDAFGQIHILLNGAGLFKDGDVELTFNVNAIGLINSSLIALDYMNKEKGGEGGYIVNIASVAGLHPVLQMPVYCGSKYAVVGFTLSMGTDYYFNKTGVKFIVICPSATNTPFFDDCNSKVLYIDKKPAEYTSLLQNMPKQTPDIVADCIIQSINADKNGAIWVSRYGKNVEFEYPPIREAVDSIQL